MCDDGGLKTCRRCGRRLPRSAFYAYATNRDGLNTRCKDCVRAHYRERYRAARAQATAARQTDAGAGAEAP